MFERYSEKARRVIFFARYEASRFNSPYIEVEHLLLGILREDKLLVHRFLKTHSAVESIRTQIEEHSTVHEKPLSSVDLPLSLEAKNVLSHALEEAGSMKSKQVDPAQLFLGVLHQEGSLAARFLNERGITLLTARAELRREPNAHGA